MTPTNFQDLLQQKLLERTNYNKDLIEEKNNLQSEMSSLPAMLRASGELSAIRNPLEREAIYSQRVNNIGSRLGTVTDLLGQRGQNFSDILRTGASAYGDYLAEQERRRSAARNSGANINSIKAKYLEANSTTDGTNATGDDETTKRVGIDPKEKRYDAFVNSGMSEEEAFYYAQNGIPQDAQRISQQGGFKGLLGKIIAPSLNQWEKMRGYRGPKRY